MSHGKAIANSEFYEGSGEMDSIIQRSMPFGFARQPETEPVPIYLMRSVKPAFVCRVQQAAAELRKGFTRESIREQHGRIVLEQAELEIRITK